MESESHQGRDRYIIEKENHNGNDKTGYKETPRQSCVEQKPEWIRETSGGRKFLRTGSLSGCEAEKKNPMDHLEKTSPT